MGSPLPKIDAAENPSAEALLDSLKTIDPGERRKHASVFNYWQSIRSNRQFPPIRDLDPLEISDAGPWSVLLEMMGGGDDAVVRHFGQAIRDGNEVEKISDASAPSLLTCIHSKLPIVAACREAYAFEDCFESEGGTTRCWVTLLPFSANGTFIDFVYGYVSVAGPAESEAEAETAEEVAEESVRTEDVAAAVEEEAVAEEPEAVEEPQSAAEPEAFQESEPEAESEEEAGATEAELEPFQVPLAPLDGDDDEVEAAADPLDELPEAAEDLAEPEPEAEADVEVEPEPEPEPEPEAFVEEDTEARAFVEQEPTVETVEQGVETEYEPERAAAQKPGFAKFLEGLANVGGFGKSQPEPEYEVEPVAELLAEADAVAAEAKAEAAFAETVEPAAEIAEEFTGAEPEPAPVEETAEPASTLEGPLHSKLSEVRALAEEAREAQIRSNMALYEGLSAAYDFALDAEEAPEEYLRMVEAQGMKIQLRSPMKPVVKLAFDGMCDEPTIKQLEAVLAWALKQDLPRGTLSERIQSEGGIGAILNGHA